MDARPFHMSSLAQDLRVAARSLARSKGFATLAALTLALGIGASTGVFSVVNGVLLRHFPFPQADRLLTINSSDRKSPDQYTAVSEPDYLEWKTQARSFSSMGASEDATFNFTGAGAAEHVTGTRATASYLDTNGVRPLIGRWFREDEEEAASVALIGEYFWTRRFARDAGILGKSITLSGRSYTVVGVLPAWFDDRDVNAVTVPIHVSADEKNRRVRVLSVFARLAPGVTFGQARAEMNGIAARQESQFRDSHAGWGVTVMHIQDAIVDDVRGLLLTLMGAVAFVLLIACANVANLLLARAGVRRREIAIRTAMGASRSRIMRQLLTESLLLALIAGALGIPLGVWSVRWLASFNDFSEAASSPLGFDGAALAFTLAISILTAALFGLAPALTASKSDLNETLKQTTRASTGGQRRLKNILVIAEVALALVLLTGAGLLIRSFQFARSQPLGFDSTNVLTALIDLPVAKYDTAQRGAALKRDLTGSVAHLPGVRGVALASSVPFQGSGVESGAMIDGVRIAEPIHTRPVSPGYFATLEIPIARGRAFTDADHDSGAVINETAARMLSANANPLGRKIKLNNGQTFTVTGVAADTREESIRQKPAATVYLPFRVESQVALLVRVANRENIDLERAVSSVDPELPVYLQRSLDRVAAQNTSDIRLMLIALAGFGGVAMLLAAVGVYGVMAYAVGQRASEIGVRMALGAARRDIARMIAWDSMRIVAVGIVVGVAGAAALTRILAYTLVRVTPLDPLTFTLAPLVLIAIAMLAAFVPARRAARVDPAIALRYE
jgi:putative ABC transport system permease protein